MHMLSIERRSRSYRQRRVFGAVGVLAALLACPACSAQTCAGPADLPPSVFVNVRALLEKEPRTQVEVCAIDCITIAEDKEFGELGPQLVIPDGDDHSLVDLRATVDRADQPPLVSNLAVELTKATNVGDCGSHVSYATVVHLDPTGNLKQGPS